MKYSFYINLFIGLSLLLMLGGCTEDQMSSMTSGRYPTITLSLPGITDVGIKTRSISDENTIDDLLVVLFRDGKAKFQSFAQPTVSDNQISLTITKFDISSGETVYVCCNAGISSVAAGSIDEFAEQHIYTNNESGMIMWGAGTFHGGNMSVDLNRAYAKASVVCEEPGITVDSWKVCNVPSQGYIAETKSGFPNLTTFTEIVGPANNDVDNPAYFIPRTNNNSISGTQNKTYLLVNLSGMGWYRLEFYNQKPAKEDASKDVPVMNLRRNTHYAFTITEVSSKGYATEEEAAANDGSNVVYDMEITTGHGASNGQYSLVLNRENVMLASVSNGGSNTIPVLEIYADIPKPQNTISTYKARLIDNAGLICENDQIYLIDDNENAVKELNLIKPGETLTIDNSKRILRMKYSGANVYNVYLEISLGNIVKRVPIDIQTSNCYLMDFATSTNQTLYIPIIQANRDGVTRITNSDILEPFIVWSDQPNVTKDNLKMDYEQDKLRIKITNDITFSGNVVVAVKLNGVIKWSWHIWSMDNTVLEFNDALKIYDFKADHENQYNGFTFMDRNLGAYTLAKDGRMSDVGLLYQFGRKDPFPGSADGGLTEQTIYHEGNVFTLTGNHPNFGACLAELNSANNLEYSIQHPHQFIKGIFSSSDDGNMYSCDWFTNDYTLVNNYLWLTDAREKTAYNPCPIGWTTPYGGMIGPWYGAHINQATVEANGLTMGNAGYFPFSPYRNIDGTLRLYFNSSNAALILRWGNNNSSRISGTTFTTTSIVGLQEVFRAQGCPIRCVREK
jgi:hypothetical protein